MNAEFVALLAKEGKLDVFEHELGNAALIATVDFGELRSTFPNLFEMVKQNLPGEGEIFSRETFSEMVEGMRDGVMSAIRDYRLGQSLQGLRTEAMAIPDATDTLARYQSSLDNELYKALRALRETQAARRRQLDSDAAPVDESSV